MIIGIGGVSNSGKSALADRLKSAFQTKSVAVVCQDDFTIPAQKIRKTGDHIDWENPQSMDFKNFRRVIIDVAKDHEIAIAEGLMVFYDPEVNRLFDKRIFVDLPYEVFARRKSADLRWGKEPGWYIDHIWNSFLQFGQPPQYGQPVIHIDGTQPFDVQQIVDELTR